MLTIFVLLAGWHSVVVPITQGEDELAHFRYLSFIAQTGRLPATPAERELAWYRSDWPPLYHLLVGWAVSPLDTTQPHLKDVGESPRRRLVGQIFYPRLIIYTADANWPWQDGILAWHIGRSVSIGFAAAALVFVFLTALELVQNWNSLTAAPRAPAPLPVSPGLFATAVTALLAFTPRFVFTSAMLSDDSLFILLSAVYLWLLLRAARGQDGWLTFAALGLLLGLSVATKYSTALLPLTLLPLLGHKVRRAGWRWTRAAARLAVSALATVIGAGWWFGWIIYHFNTIPQDGPVFGLFSPLLASGPDVSMRRVFAFFGGEAFSGQLRPDAVAQGDWPGYFGYLFQTYWGVPVLEFDPLWPWAYLPLLAFVISAAIGLARAWRRADSPVRVQLGLLALTALLLVPFPLLRFFLTYNILETGQGRHILYPAAQSIPLLLMLGWLTFWQGRGGTAAQAEHATRNPHPNHSPFTIIFFLPPSLLLLWSLWQPIYMARAYPPPLPVQTTTFDVAAIPQPLKHDFGDAVQLLGYDFQPDPDQAIINLTLYWKALAQADENYRVQVQLIDPAGKPRFTWLSHPLNGRYPTRAWDNGDVIRDHLPLPLAAVPPATYQITVDLLREAEPLSVSGEPFQFIQFDLGQQQPIPNAAALGDWQYRLWLDDAPLRPRQTIALSIRNTEHNSQNTEAGIQTPELALIGPDGQPQPPDALTDATAIWLVGGNWPGGDYQLSINGETTPAPVLAVDVPPLLTNLPPELAGLPGWTPLEANFAGQIKLIGAALPQRFAQPGSAIPVSLAWRGLLEPLPDAVTFAVLLDADQQPHGSIDRYPQGFYSPLLWLPGEVVPDNFTLPVAAAAPPGVYNIHLGQYVPQPDGSLRYLPLVADGQPTDTTAVILGPLKIGGPPPEVIAPNPQPQVVVNQPFGENITLLGYNQESGVRSQESGNNSLSLKLYWQANAVPAANYTTFVHLRDAAGQNVAQKDGPPAAGRYPTSLWEPGEIIADEIVLPLDQLPPGEYTPVVGLYHPDTGERLLTPGHPANEITLQPVQVTTDP